MLKIQDSTAQTIREVIVKEIAGTLSLQYNSEFNIESRIHEYRKAIKRCRALLRLLKNFIGENVFETIDKKLSMAAGDMAQRRDATVNLRSFINLSLAYSHTITENIRQSITNELTEKVKKAYETEIIDPVKTEESILIFLKTILDELNEIRIKPATHSDFSTAIEKSYFKAANLFTDAKNSLETEVIHKFRKFTKHLLFQLKFTPDLDKTYLNPLITKLDNISDFLGKEHDLAVLDKTLATNTNLLKEDLLKVHLIIVKERARLQKETFRLAEEVYSEENVRNFKVNIQAPVSN